MADATQPRLSFEPDWRKRICDDRGRIKDDGTRQDYDEASRETAQALMEAYLREARKRAAREKRLVTREELQQARRDAARESRKCVESMDWEKHQLARGDPDPRAPGRIRAVHDFSREESLRTVSRSEMNRTVEKNGVYSSLKADGVNFVGLGEEDKDLDSRQIQDHFALPRGQEERSDYRIAYRLEEAAAGEARCFALCDDCSGGIWTIEGKDPFHRPGGGRQGVIILGGEHFQAPTDGNRVLAHDRRTRQPGRVPMNRDDPRYREEAGGSLRLRWVGRGRD